jgi:PKD repeat protein
MKKFLNHFFTIVFLLLLNINNLSAQNFCGQDIALQNQIQYAGTLNNIYNGFEACGNSYFSYDAVHSFISESAGTATISFEENLFSGFDLLILDGCNADISSCIFSAYSDEDLAGGLSFNVSSSTEYYIIIAESVFGAGGSLDYTIQVDYPASTGNCSINSSDFICEPWFLNEVANYFTCTQGLCGSIDLYTSPSGECAIDFVIEQGCMLLACPAHVVFNENGAEIANYSSECGLVDQGYTFIEEVWNCSEGLESLEGEVTGTLDIQINGLEVECNFISNSIINNYFWTFGDGNSSNNQIGSHTYTSNGNYNICLSATGNCAANLFCQEINIDIDNCLIGIVDCQQEFDEITFSWSNDINVSNYFVNVISGQTSGILEQLSNPVSYTVSNLGINELVQIEITANGDCVGMTSDIISCSTLECNLPNIILTPSQTELCLNSFSNNITIDIDITPNIPGQGVFSGPSVDPITGELDVSSAGIGEHTINYQYELQANSECITNASTTVSIYEQPLILYLGTEETICIMESTNLEFDATADIIILDDGGASNIQQVNETTFNLSWDTPGLKIVRARAENDNCISDEIEFIINVDLALSEPVITCIEGIDQIQFQWDEISDELSVSGLQGIEHTLSLNGLIVTGLSQGQELIFDLVIISPNTCDDLVIPLYCTTIDCSSETYTIDPVDPICQGESTTLSINSNNLISYEWSDQDNNPLGNSNNIIVNPESNSNYSLVAEHNNGCIYELATTVFVNPLPEFQITGDSLICPNDMAIYQTNPSPTTWSHTWQNSNENILSQESIVELNESEFIFAQVIDNNGCTYSDSLNVTIDYCICPVDSYLDLEDEFVTSLPYEEESIFLLSNDLYPPEGTLEIIDISHPDLFSSTDLVNGSFIYTIDQSFSDTIFVNYQVCEPSCNNCDQAILKIFNEEIIDITQTTFIIENSLNTNKLVFSETSPIPESELWIYNRWGNQVYHTKDYENNWTAEGLPGGVYFYVLEVRGVVIKQTLTVFK